jgi:hypothetical protein
MKKPIFLLGALSLALACSKDSTAVSPDAIDGRELAAVRGTLDSAFTGDTELYPLLAELVFPYLDRASFIVSGSDTTRVVGVELDIQATLQGAPILADFTGVLAWRGYRPATHTVDSVFFILGAGRAPVQDSLRSTWSPDTAGTGSGYVLHEAADSTVTAWLARAGHLHTTASTYGSGHKQTFGNGSLTTFHGTLNGDFAITARLVPDSSTTVSSGKDFGSGAQALKVQIRGSF